MKIIIGIILFAIIIWADIKIEKEQEKEDIEFYKKYGIFPCCEDWD